MALFLVVVILAAGLACFFTMHWLLLPVTSARVAESEPHRWLHEQLGLTAAQEQKLVPMEQRFAAERTRLVEQIRAANRELAAAMQEDGRYSPRVEAAIEKIHHAQGELQKATVRHCLEMPEVLTPEQSRKLLDLTGEALAHDAQ